MSDGGPHVSLGVTAGSPTDEETAAIAAVLTELVLERAASTLPLARDAATSAWQRSARGLRQPLPRGAWRH